MSVSSLYKMPSEEEEKRIKEVVNKVQDFELLPLFKKLSKIWIFILFIVFTLLFTIITSVKLSISIWH